MQKQQTLELLSSIGIEESEAADVLWQEMGLVEDAHITEVDSYFGRRNAKPGASSMHVQDACQHDAGPSAQLFVMILLDRDCSRSMQRTASQVLSHTFLVLQDVWDRHMVQFIRRNAERHANMFVVNATTPAQLFHALRRQMNRPFQKPLVLLTPKFLLHHRPATSALSDFAIGTHFNRVIDDCKVSLFRVHLAIVGFVILTDRMRNVRGVAACCLYVHIRKLWFRRLRTTRGISPDIRKRENRTWFHPQRCGALSFAAAQYSTTSAMRGGLAKSGTLLWSGSSSLLRSLTTSSLRCTLHLHCHMRKMKAVYL